MEVFTNINIGNRERRILTLITKSEEDSRKNTVTWKRNCAKKEV